MKMMMRVASGSDQESPPISDRDPSNFPRPSVRYPLNPAKSSTGLARDLRRLAGVHEATLDWVPTERARYTALGGVVLGTAIMATFSMWNAINEVAGHVILLSFPIAALWGIFICNLDRWLVSTSAYAALRARIGVLLPRLVLAVIFGIVVAEPLVLRVFQNAIEQHLASEQQDTVGGYRSKLERCNPPLVASADDNDSADCKDALLTIPGAPRDLATQVASETVTLKELNTRFAHDTEALNGLNSRAQSECAGDSGPGLTGNYGAGVNCNADRAAAKQFAESHDLAQQAQAIADKTASLSVLRTTLSEAGATYAAQRTSLIDKAVAIRNSSYQRPGLLERIEALDELTSEHAVLRIARWLITFFFIAIDCLPVIVKFFGGATNYERMLAMESSERAELFKSILQEDRSSQSLPYDVKTYANGSTLKTQRVRIDNSATFLDGVSEVDLEKDIDELADRYEHDDGGVQRTIVLLDASDDSEDSRRGNGRDNGPR